MYDFDQRDTDFPFQYNFPHSVCMPMINLDLISILLVMVTSKFELHHYFGNQYKMIDILVYTPRYLNILCLHHERASLTRDTSVLHDDRLFCQFVYSRDTTILPPTCPIMAIFKLKYSACMGVFV